MVQVAAKLPSSSMVKPSLLLRVIVFPVTALLRFIDNQIESGSPQLNPWSWLFESSVQDTDDPVAAWRTVCVGLIIHPNFYSY